MRELGSGDSIVVLAADPTRASFGEEDDALREAMVLPLLQGFVVRI